MISRSQDRMLRRFLQGYFPKPKTRTRRNATFKALERRGGIVSANGVWEVVRAKAAELTSRTKRAPATIVED